MPINFVTGLPRHGKTLWTITHVRALAEKEHRQVYYCNIPGVTIPGWIEFDHPDKWVDLPDGAIIIVDELQDFWPKALSGARPTPPILELSKHGKRGFDMWFITQEPNLVHSTPRDLCAHHYYVVRAWGTHKAMVHKFERMALHPDKQKSKSEKFPFIYPKKAFDWYKSADVHNIKRQIPLKLLAIPLGVVFAGAMLWFGAGLFKGAVSGAVKNPADTISGARPPSASLPSSVASGGPSPARGPLSRDEWLAQQQPRIPGLPHTAPVYDQVTAATVAPRPAACVSMRDKCSCYTQQATLMQVPHALCMQIVASGYFQSWQEAKKVDAEPRQAPASVPRGESHSLPYVAPVKSGNHIAVSEIPQAIAMRPAFGGVK